MEDIKFICLDLETTGLIPKEDCILEIGISVTDESLNILDSFQSIVWPTVDVSSLDSFVKEMHTSNNLLSDIANINFDNVHDIPFVEIVEKNVLQWFDSLGLEKNKYPMMGSSVHFDRGFLKVHMPELESFFSFMNIDVSSIKNLVKIWNPDDKWNRSIDKSHRALSDVKDTLNEASFYYEKFFNRSKNA